MKRTPAYWAIAIGLLIGLGGCAGGPKQAALPLLPVAKVRTLSGVVVENPSGEPIAGAQVRLGERAIETDAQGAFTLEVGKPAPLEVSCRGYVPKVIPSEEVGPALREDGQGGETLRIMLHPRTLSGQVLEAGSGRPLQGVTLRAGQSQAISDEEGHFLLQYIEVGDTLTVESAAHHPVDPILLRDQESLTLTLEPWRVALSVSDQANGQPLAGAHVEGASQRAETDASGQAVLTPRLGETILIHLTGYCTETLTYQGEPSLSVPLRPSRLIVRLKDASTQEPIPDGLVQVFERGKSAPRLGCTDENGQLDLSDAAEAERLFIKAANYVRASVPITQMGVVEVALEPFISRGIYIPFGLLTRPEYVRNLIELVDRSPTLNTVVVDVKADIAYLAWPSKNPLAQEADAYFEGVMPLEEVLRLCHERGIYTIARMVIFKDDLLVKIRPEWAIVRQDGTFYTDGQNTKWVDPFRKEVWDYNIALAVEVAEMGFDEVQFDYIRFPSDGRIRDLVYPQESTFESRIGAISGFLKEAHAALEATPAFFSADIYGLSVWVTDPNCPRQPLCDLGIGQWVEDIAAHVDYLSPMLYPATFAPGSLGFAQPVAHPYEVVYYSMVKVLGRTTTPVRPWLQHYSALGVVYDTRKLLEQMKAAEDAGSHGWLFWNAGGKYEEAIFGEKPFDLVAGLPTPPPPKE